MKALLYKEFKLAMHPVCYIFILVFPLLAFAPDYPLAIGFIYILTCYPILFLGANKGQQSNDLLFSTLLPVRKKDIVLARIITVLLMQLAFIILLLIVAPFGARSSAAIAETAIQDGGVAPVVPGLGYKSILTIVSIALICLSIADLIFFSIYYHNGRSILLSTLLSLIVFIILICGLTIVLPLIPSITPFFDAIDNSVLYRFITIMIGVFASAIIHFITYKIASSELEKVDF